MRSLSTTLILALLIILSSCGSRKITTATHVDSNLTERIESQIQEDKTRYVIETIKGELNQDVYVRIVEYDTDKPVELSTGKRPVKKETFIDSNTKKNGEYEKKEAENNVKNENTTIDKEKKQVTDIKTVEDRRESKQFYYLALILISISILVILLYFIVKKVNGLWRK
ncbi:hypothetical protein PF672P2_00013 [Parabacteroides phage PF672P2]|nr:hypothetical protein PF672P1_00052 [Parabacteroides phage PF672P1]WAX17150.1 hypothetical protein PF672P2_00013 [Parabacteroides phage PF672P2]